MEKGVGERWNDVGEEMKYQITKKQCQESIRGICSYCGGKLEPIETVDNSGNPTFWVGCVPCGVFDNGTDPKTYEIAKKAGNGT